MTYKNWVIDCCREKRVIGCAICIKNGERVVIPETDDIDHDMEVTPLRMNTFPDLMKDMTLICLDINNKLTTLVTAKL